MTLTELLEALSNGHREFKDEDFGDKISLVFLDTYSRNSLSFIRCRFLEDVELYGINKPELYIDFHKCTFKKPVIATACKLSRLAFYGLLEVPNLQISNVQLNILAIDSGNQPLDAYISLDGINVKTSLDCSKLNINTGDFVINLINTKEESQDNLTVNFKESRLDNINFYGNFGKKSIFDNFIINRGLFINCTFNTSSFNGAQLGENTAFGSCIFESKASFISCKCLQNTILTFTDCQFKSPVYFNGSSLDSLSIMRTIFESSASFERLTVNTISLYQVLFQQGAYFDEVSISNIFNKRHLHQLKLGEAHNLRSTLRVIKQELQKTENKIDYNRFRSYELEAHYHELRAAKKPFFNSDRFILWATKLVTGFDHSWRKALNFTIITGLTWYSIIYFTEYNGPFNFQELNTYFNGAFRFFLITDFSSPFKEKGEYLEDAWKWVPLIVGKIFIAFGIYEMIQAFRKFKA